MLNDLCKEFRKGFIHGLSGLYQGCILGFAILHKVLHGLYGMAVGVSVVGLGLVFWV